MHEAELHRGLLHALGEVALVEGEAKLSVLEHVVRARLVVPALGRVAIHDERRPIPGRVGILSRIPAPLEGVQPCLHR